VERTTPASGRPLLGKGEDVFPQPGFQVAFHLRQISEIDQCAHGRGTVDEQVAFVEMPPTGRSRSSRPDPEQHDRGPLSEGSTGRTPTAVTRTGPSTARSDRDSHCSVRRPG
jgi:hypothetical protein